MSLDKVPRTGSLYIGSIFCLRRPAALREANITHIVSALRAPVEKSLLEGYRHLAVEVDDVSEEDIIQHFATSNAFIQEGLDGGGAVLVHCAMGKSRSATLVIAYLLSKFPSETPSSALELLRSVHSIAEPNEGFWEQLELFHRMGCPEDVATQSQYQRWLYQREIEASVACGRAPEIIRFEDEVAAPEKNVTEKDLEIRCRRCRRSLATSVYLNLHEPKPASATQAAAALGPISSLQADKKAAPPPQCAHLFVDPLSWMRPELEQGKLEGRLDCPNEKCKNHVGKYAWQGMRCSCGKWVVPAITLARGRVDEVDLKARAPLRGFEGKM